MDGYHNRYGPGDVSPEQMKVHGKGLHLNRRLPSFVKPMLLALALVAFLFALLVFKESPEVRHPPQQSLESSSIDHFIPNLRLEGSTQVQPAIARVG